MIKVERAYRPQADVEIRIDSGEAGDLYEFLKKHQPTSTNETRELLTHLIRLFDDMYKKEQRVRLCKKCK